MTCTCAQRLDHSKVIDSRFRWLNRKERYEKYRRRQCLVCGKKFSTIEIDKDTKTTFRERWELLNDTKTL